MLFSVVNIGFGFVTSGMFQLIIYPIFNIAFIYITQFIVPFTEKRQKFEDLKRVCRKISADLELNLIPSENETIFNIIDKLSDTLDEKSLLEYLSSLLIQIGLVSMELT